MADAPDLAVIDAAGMRLDVDDLKARVAQLETALTLVQRDLVAEKAPTAPEGADALQQRLDRMESGLSDHDERLTALSGRLAVVEAGQGTDAPQTAPDGEPLTKGEGLGRRLTTAGEAEIRRLLDLGWSNRRISDRVGCSKETVQDRRKKLEKAAADASPDAGGQGDAATADAAPQDA